MHDVYDVRRRESGLARTSEVNPLDALSEFVVQDVWPCIRHRALTSQASESDAATSALVESSGIARFFWSRYWSCLESYA